jgi:hypothetical protein
VKRVIVTVGPRGAGKTSFCEQIVRHRPEVTLVSRDAIFKELFGKVNLNPYTGDDFYGLQVMWKRTGDYLNNGAAVLILDTWNGSREARWDITYKLRSLGAERIEAWRFVTPASHIVQWFLKKEPEDRKSSPRILDDYRLYHSRPVELKQGFDAIHLINPLQQTLFSYSYLLI